jgi:hypothetical protein
MVTAMSVCVRLCVWAPDVDELEGSYGHLPEGTTARLPLLVLDGEGPRQNSTHQAGSQLESWQHVLHTQRWCRLACPPAGGVACCAEGCWQKHTGKQ